MTIPDGTYLPPQLTNHPRRNRAVLPILAFIIIVFFGSLAVGVFSLYTSASKSAGTAKKVADQFLQAMKDHRYDAAEALMTPDAQQVTDATALQTLQKTEEQNNGKLLSLSPTSWFISNFNGDVMVTMDYAMSFKAETRPSEVTLERQSNGRFEVYHLTVPN